MVTLSEAFTKRNQQFRDSLFRPILKILTNLGITANHLSNLKLIFFLPFFFFAFKDLKTAYLFFLFSILIDLIDGPISRYQKNNSDRGKFIDIFGDFTIYLSIILTLFYLNLFNNNFLAYHLFIFPLTVILATIKKQEKKKTDWIIKPAPELAHSNAFFLFLLFLFIYFKINLINLGLFLINAYFTFLTIYYFIFIQIRWNKNNLK